MGQGAKRQIKLLVVDDDLDDLRWYSVMLRRNGYEVDACSSYEEGAKRAAREHYDFVLVGQGGPEFEGQRVIRRAKELDRGRPVLVVARCPEVPCYLEAMQLGAFDYLAKPVSRWELVKAVERHVSMSATA